MKNRMFIIALVVSAVFCCAAARSIENPGIGNSVGLSTVPPSTYSSGLSENPASIDSSGNLLMTGNVRRGRHFRGDVPYRSPTSFGSNLGSSALRSFLRDSAGTEDLKAGSNRYGTQPYYHPTETVTTMQPGQSEIFMPENTRLSTRAHADTRLGDAGVFNNQTAQREQALFGQGVTAGDSLTSGSAAQYGPLAQSRLMLESKFPTSMSLNLRSREQSRLAETGLSTQDRMSSAELFSERNQGVADRTQEPTIDAGRGREGLWKKDEPFQLQNRESNIDNLRPSFETQSSERNREEDGKQNISYNRGRLDLKQFAPSTDSVSQDNPFLKKGTYESVTNKKFQTAQEQISRSSQEQGDVLERIRRQLEDLTRTIDTAIESQEPPEDRRDADKQVNVERIAEKQENILGHQRQNIFRDWMNSSGYSNYYGAHKGESGFGEEDSFKTGGGGLNQTDVSGQSGLEFSGVPSYKNYQKRRSPLDELNKLSRAEISAEASQIMGSHNSIDSLSQSKFNQHMRDAEEHLKAGRYYRAAGCFSLASVYQPNSPLALAGRGHALFAAGEYVSSALFLSRAIAISPEYLQMRVDLASILGDRNKLASRIEDIEQWLARSGSSQLQFLLGYVYYRTGQLLRAKKAIDAAYEQTPELPAIRIMKITIDNVMMRR